MKTVLKNRLFSKNDTTFQIFKNIYFEVDT